MVVAKCATPFEVFIEKEVSPYKNMTAVRGEVFFNIFVIIFGS